MFAYRCSSYEQALGSSAITHFEATFIRFKISWIFKAKNQGSMQVQEAFVLPSNDFLENPFGKHLRDHIKYEL